MVRGTVALVMFSAKDGLLTDDLFATVLFYTIEVFLAIAVTFFTATKVLMVVVLVPFLRTIAFVWLVLILVEFCCAAVELLAFTTVTFCTLGTATFLAEVKFIFLANSLSFCFY